MSEPFNPLFGFVNGFADVAHFADCRGYRLQRRLSRLHGTAGDVITRLRRIGNALHRLCRCCELIDSIADLHTFGGGHIGDDSTLTPDLLGRLLHLLGDAPDV